MGLGGAPRRVDCVECPTLLGLWAVFVQKLDGPPRHAHMTCVGRNGLRAWVGQSGMFKLLLEIHNTENNRFCLKTNGV